jgi:hypothetical protein
MYCGVWSILLTHLNRPICRFPKDSDAHTNKISCDVLGRYMRIHPFYSGLCRRAEWDILDL